jgi:hypothetical protein
MPKKTFAAEQIVGKLRLASRGERSAISRRKGTTKTS